MFLAALVDCLGLLAFYDRMYLTVIITVCIIFIEGKSVFENLRKQDSKVKDIPAALSELLQNKEKLQEVIKILKKNEA
jgi:hypothetical protein